MARSSNATSGWKLANASVGTGFSTNAGPWTIAFWFKAGSNALTNRYAAVFIDGTSGEQLAVLYEFVNNTIELYDSNVDTRTNSGIVVADTTTWHHIGYRYAGAAGAYDKFLDGVKTSINASATFTVLAAAGTTSFTMFSSGSASEINAAIEQFGVWRAALTDQNMADLAAGTLEGSTLSSPVFYWPLCGTASPEPDLGSANKSLTVTNVVLATGPVITSTCSVAGFMPRKNPRVREAVNRASYY